MKFCYKKRVILKYERREMMNKYKLYNSILIIIFLAIFAWNNYSSDKRITFPILVLTGIVFSLLSIINRRKNFHGK